MNWQRILENAVRFEQLDSRNLTILTVGSFVAITLVFYLVGKLILGIGRNRLPEEQAIGSRRPLVLGRLTEAFAYMLPISKAKEDRLRKELMQAGYYHRRAFEEFAGFRNAAMVAWLVLVGTTMVALAEPQENMTPKVLLAGGVVLLIVYGLPRIILSSQANARCQRIQFTLPDALDMINMTVTGGLPMRQAFARVSQELKPTHPDVACELAIIDLQSETGSLDLALKQFARRIEIPDVAALATMVHQAEKLGGQVANAFRDFSDGVRRSRRQQAEERGNKASVKLLLPIVFFLAPPIYILLLGPAMIELKNFVKRESGPGGALSQSVRSGQPGALRSTGNANTPAGGNNTLTPGQDQPTPALPSVLRNRPSRQSD